MPPSTMTVKRRLEALSQQVVEGIPDAGTFEGIPKIRHVAQDSVGPYVLIVTMSTPWYDKADKIRLQSTLDLTQYNSQPAGTGANSPNGIGRASAHQYAHNGAKAVYICDYNDSHLATHKREMEQLYPGVNIHTRQFDAGDEEGVKEVVGDALRRYGRLDIFFANAGVGGQAKFFSDITLEEFEKTLHTNASSVFLAAKHASLAMKKTSPTKPYPSGSIICTASVAGLRSNAGSTDYSIAKAGVISLAQTCAYQLSGTGIRINAICPGLTETGMTKPVFDAAQARGTTRKIGQLNPLQRGAVADEIARVALFLGSDESSYVNGQAWAVCGGLSAGHPVVSGKLA